MNSAVPLSPTPARRIAAWGVHLLTASSALWGLLATLALVQGHWKAMFWWLAATVLVDGVDGALARKADVKRVLPGFDGALLDNIVDYVTYAFIPAVFLCVSGMLPAGWGVVGAGAIVLSSAYQFAQIDAKTEDHFFQGFPSYWNIVALYLFLLGTGPEANLAVVVICAILVFVPLRYAYPTRMTRFRAPTLALTVLWALLLVVMLALYPNVPAWLKALSLAYPVYYIAISAVTGKMQGKS